MDELIPDYYDDDVDRQAEDYIIEQSMKAWIANRYRAKYPDLRTAMIDPWIRPEGENP